MLKSLMCRLSDVKKYAFLVAMICISFLFTIFYNSADWDLWARMAVGAIFFQTGTVFKHDIFAYTPTKNLWVDHEWGSGVVFYFLSHYFGDFGLLFLKFFIIFFIFIFIFNNNQLKKEKNTCAYSIIYYLFSIYAMMPGFVNTIRSQSFTYFFFAMWFYLLNLVREGKNRILFIFPLLMLIWANLHGGFLAGIGLLLIYAIAEAVNKREFVKYLWTLLACFTATLINPYGFKYWAYLIDAVTMNRPYIPEWDPINFFASVGQYWSFKLFFILAILSYVFIFVKKRFKDINWSEFAVLCVTFYMAISHKRHLVFFVIAASSSIYYYIGSASNWLSSVLSFKGKNFIPPIVTRVLNNAKDITVYFFIFAISLIIVSFKPIKVAVLPSQFPVKAVEFIKINKLKGNLLVLFNWGSYALWNLYPDNKIAVDGRYEEVYSNAFINEVARFHYSGANWDDLLVKYHTDVILLPTNYDCYKQVLMIKNWKEIYKDEWASVFVPRSRDKGKWISVSSKFNIDKTKYKTEMNFKKAL